MIDLILILILALILGLACRYVYKAKKTGAVKCIGCPAGGGYTCPGCHTGDAE